jgi:excisionase family DNA binding protein
MIDEDKCSGDNVSVMVEKLYSPEEAADLLGISLRTMRTMIKREEIRHVRIGRLVRISDGDLQTFIDNRKRGG